MSEMFIMPKVSFNFIDEVMPNFPRILEVYVYLRRHAILDDYENQKLIVVYKKMAIIEVELKITKKTIIKLVDQLFKLGWIEVEKYKLPDGKVMNIYVLGKWYVDEYNRVIEKYKGDVDYE